ncbi:MAG: deoxyribonuclease V [Deltaproteobacteria bacterium]|nr:MAG: deoxyribonuclease V [Deltaproteobacteria bacterium]
MEIPDKHPWNVTYKEAVRIQKCLKDKVILKKINKRIKYVAGLDVSYAKGSNKMWAGVIVLDFPSLGKTEERWSQKKVSFPYIPGLLSFREIPALIDALRKIEIEPDLIFCDGQGIAHPRGLGLASHLGVLLNKPTIGCAKSLLVGKYNQVREHKGDYVYLRHQNRVIGAVVRTKSKVKPIFISPGYGIMLNDCIKFVLETCLTYRIPEPTRQAHLLVNSVRSGKFSVPI